MYDPTVGRFLEEDPIGIEAGDPNFYRYCGNAPLIYVDPAGLGVVLPGGSPAGGYITMPITTGPTGAVGDKPTGGSTNQLPSGVGTIPFVPGVYVIPFCGGLAPVTPGDPFIDPLTSKYVDLHLDLSIFIVNHLPLPGAEEMHDVDTYLIQYLYELLNPPPPYSRPLSDWFKSPYASSSGPEKPAAPDTFYSGPPTAFGSPIPAVPFMGYYVPGSLTPSKSGEKGRQRCN
jgi:hypothetical protein